MSFGVALFRNNKYEGQVAREARIKSWEDALMVAARWTKGHAGKHDYRAVEYDAHGMLIRQEKPLLSNNQNGPHQSTN